MTKTPPVGGVRFVGCGEVPLFGRDDQGVVNVLLAWDDDVIHAVFKACDALLCAGCSHVDSINFAGQVGQ